MKRLSSVILFILLFSPSLFGQNLYTYSEPAKLKDGWETTNLQSLNVDTSRIYQLFNQLRDGKHKIHSIVLVKDGQLVIEEYFDNYSTNKQHDLRSATKSITSLLMGIALDKGFIDSIDDPLATYISQPAPRKNQDSRKQQITIRHLLTMSTGLDCNDWDRKSKGQEDRVYRQDNWLQYFLDLPMLNDPGTVSNYCTMGQVLSTEIISRASGMPIDSFAEQYLFRPLNIENVSWGHTFKKEVLASAKRLYMTPRDMAKIGQLILNNGHWYGEQLVSEKWIQESTLAKTTITGMEYGFFWWNIPLQANENTFTTIAATGNGGQFIFVNPELDMVAVFTGGAYNSQEDKLPFAIMQDIFIHTFITKL